MAEPHNSKGSKSAKLPDTIGGWLTLQQGFEFTEYATKIGIDQSALATILIVRELSRDRLSSLLLADSGKVPGKGKRVSARTRHADLKARFAVHAAKHGVSADAASATLFRAELSERWLAGVLGIEWESA